MGQKIAAAAGPSWNGVAIDPDSIRLTVLDHPDRVTLLNVSYPPNENALVWELSSTEASQEKVRISYLLTAIDRLITYKAVANNVAFVKFNHRNRFYFMKNLQRMHKSRLCFWR